MNPLKQPLHIDSSLIKISISSRFWGHPNYVLILRQVQDLGLIELDKIHRGVLLQAEKAPLDPSFKWINCIICKSAEGPLNPSVC